MPLLAPSRRPLLLRRPAVRSELTLTPAAAAVGATWTPVEGATAYTLERSPDGSTWTPVYTGANTYYSDLLLPPGNSYAYRVTPALPGLTAAASTVRQATPLVGGAASPAFLLWAEDAWSATSGGSLVTADAADVLRLRDRSGNGRDFAAVTGTQKATLRTNQANGHPVVRADQATARTYFTMAARFPVNDFYAIVVQKPNLANTNNILLGDDSTTSPTHYWMNFNSGRNSLFFDATSVASNTGIEVSNTAFSFNAAQRWGTAGGGTSPALPRGTWYRGGHWYAGVSTPFVGTTCTGGAGGLMRLFNRGTTTPATNEYWGGDFAFLAYWPVDAHTLYPLVIAQLNQWIASYYGIAAQNLAAPANVTATITGATEVTLTWDAVTGAHSYQVYRGTAPCGQVIIPANLELCGTVKAGSTPLESGSPVEYVAEELVTGQRYWWVVQATADTNQIPGQLSAEVTALPSPLPPTLLTGYNLDFDAAACFKDSAGTTPATANGDVVQLLTDGAGVGNATATGGATGQATLRVYPDGRRSVIANGTATQFDIAGARSYGDFHLYLVGDSLDENVTAGTIRVLLGDKAAAKFLLRWSKSTVQFYDGSAGTTADNTMTVRLRSLIEIQRSGTTLRVFANRKQRGLNLTVPSTAVTLDALFALNSANFASFELQRLVIYPGVHTLAQRAQQWAYFDAQYNLSDGADTYQYVGRTTRLGWRAIGNACVLANGDRICAFHDGATTEGATCRAWWTRSRSGGRAFQPVHQRKRYQTNGLGIAAYVGTTSQLPMNHPTNPGRILSTTFDNVSPTSARNPMPIYSDWGGDPGTWVEGTLIPNPPGFTWINVYGRKYADVDGSTLLLSFYGPNSTTGYYDMGILKSLDAGLTWTQKVIISAGTAARQPDECSIVSTGGSNQLAVWRRDTSAGMYEYATSTDNGNTWSASAPFTPAGSGGEVMISPYFVKLANGHIWLFIGLRPAGIAAIRSTDNAATWSARKWVSRAGMEGNNGYPEAYERPDGKIELYWHQSTTTPVLPPNDRAEMWRTIIDPASFFLF